jgi:hypothetical protein
VIKNAHRVLSVLAALAACSALVAPAAASAAAETIGELGRPGAGCAEVGEGNIYLQSYSADTTGTIIEWSFQTGETVPAPTTKLKVLSGGSGYFTVTGEAAVGPLVPEAVNTFDVAIPVVKGERLGLYTGSPSAGQCFRGDMYASGAEIHGDVPVGSSAGSSGLKTGYRATISAVILPPPVLTAVSPQVGPSTGGTEVTITGENLRRVESVSFGAIPATSFREVGEGELRALAPASAAGPVDVEVTTAAGATPIVAGDRFTYSAPPSPAGTAGGGGASDGAGAGPKDPPAAVGPGPVVCEVPNLDGRKLKAARKAIRAADCRLGKLRKARHVTASTGTVKSQAPKPGKSVPAGTKITIQLG